jgi:hypothetical protein
MFAEELVTPTPDGEEPVLSAKNDAALRSSQMSPVSGTSTSEVRQSRVSFIDVEGTGKASKDEQEPEEPLDPIDVWVKATLKNIKDNVRKREDPFQINGWVRDLANEICVKVAKKSALASSSNFAKSVVGECIILASLTDWSKQCLRGIMDKQNSSTKRRSSLTMAAPMFLDASVQREFGSTRIIALDAGKADQSIELGQ